MTGEQALHARHAFELFFAVHDYHEQGAKRRRGYQAGRGSHPGELASGGTGCWPGGSPPIRVLFALYSNPMIGEAGNLIGEMIIFIFFRKARFQPFGKAGNTGERFTFGKKYLFALF